MVRFHCGISSGTNSIRPGPHPHNLIISQRPHLQILSHWGLGLQFRGGHKYPVHNKKIFFGCLLYSHSIYSLLFSFLTDSLVSIEKGLNQRLGQDMPSHCGHFLVNSLSRYIEGNQIDKFLLQILLFQEVYPDHPI